MSPYVLALAVVTAVDAPATAVPAVPRALIVPIEVSAGTSATGRGAARDVENALAASYARHSGLQVLSTAAVESIMGEEAARQMLGCSTAECATGIASALAAEWLLVMRLDVQPGLWSLEVALVQHQGLRVVQRSGVKTRDLDGLLASLDTVGRQLARGMQHSLEDPTLQSRLRTDAAGLAALRSEAARSPGSDVTRAWTNVVVNANRESGWWALAEGAWLLVGAVGVVTWAAIAGIAHGLYVTQTPAAAPGTFLGRIYEIQLFNPPSTQYRQDADGRIRFPAAVALASLVVPLPAMALWLVPPAAALAMAVVDRQDRGRVKVGADGCCRDELAIRAADRPSLLHRLAPILAGLGAMCALPAPLALGVLMMTSSFVFVGRSMTGLPEVPLSLDAYQASYALVQLVTYATVAAVGLGYASLSLAVAVLLGMTERSRVLDDEARSE